MKKLIETKAMKWLSKFSASIIIVVVGFILLTFFPKDADEQIITPIYTGTLGGVVIILACVGLGVDGIRALFKKQP